MKALILAAGFGTRLYPLTRHTAKPLLKIRDKPMIEYTLKKISQIDSLEEMHIVINNKFYADFLDWKHNSEFKDKIRLINNGVNNDEEKMGAIGDLKNALKYIGLGDTLVLAGDNLFEFDLRKLLEAAIKKNSSAVALKRIYNPELIKKYSCVKINNQNKITYFKEKPKNPASNIIATACYFIKKEDLQRIIQHEFKNKDNMGELIAFLCKNSQVYGEIFEDFWIDVGAFEELQRVQNMQPKTL